MSPVKVKAVISDMTGKTEMEVQDAGKIDIRSLMPGLHLVSLYDESGRRVALQKLVKE